MFGKNSKFHHVNDGTNDIVRQATPLIFYGSAAQLQFLFGISMEKDVSSFNDGGWGWPAMLICLCRLFCPASGFSLNHHVTYAVVIVTSMYHVE